MAAQDDESWCMPVECCGTTDPGLQQMQVCYLKAA